MKLVPRSIDLAVTDCVSRMPFRYGVMTLERAPLCCARVSVDSEAGAAEGFAADLLAPKWFAKDPAKTPLEDSLDLAASARAAAATVLAGAEDTVFGHWWRAYGELVHERPIDAPDRLVRGFGVALVERALIDAACRAAGTSFFDALREDLLGFRPGRLTPLLGAADHRTGIPARPLDSVRVRHTVGMLDPLRARDVRDEERLDDGLPQALDEVIATYGVRLFKVKLCGRLAADLARLRALAEVWSELVPGGVEWTLDGNEQFHDAETVAALLEALERDPLTAPFLESLLWIEQPLARGDTFDPERTAALDRVRARAPVVIDEADTGLESFPRALERGYSGVSVKNCKGVFRALANAALCAVLPGAPFQTAEDLTNLGVLALQQDLATVAALGLEHVERNGHHYFRGLDHLPAAERARALDRHATLWRGAGAGVFLDVRDGRLDLRTLACAGYAHDVPPDLAARTPLDAWEAAARA